jgi:polysaccharide pyruvyl transferase WcaK-like protein
MPGSLEEARQELGSARLVIGSRMHACLNALSSGTPAIAWAYSRKFAPLLADLGWHAAVDLRTPDDPVAPTLALVDELARAETAARVATLRDRASEQLDRVVRSLRSVI